MSIPVYMNYHIKHGGAVLRVFFYITTGRILHEQLLSLILKALNHEKHSFTKVWI